MSRWYRAYAGMMRDDKLVRVAIRSGQTIERVCWIWGAILESAAEVDDDGRYDVDSAEAAYFLRADQCDVDAILHALSAANRVADGRVVKWGNRQFQSDRSKDRVAAHRERERAKRDGSNVQTKAGNADVTLHDRQRNAPETETETEVSEPKGSSPRLWACPPKVDPKHWRDLLKNRKTRRLTNSETAYEGQLKAIAEIADDEWPPGRLVQHAAAKGWGSINDPRKSLNGSNHDRTDRDPTTVALERLLGGNVGAHVGTG